MQSLTIFLIYLLTVFISWLLQREIFKKEPFWRNEAAGEFFMVMLIPFLNIITSLSFYCDEIVENATIEIDLRKLYLLPKEGKMSRKQGGKDKK